jgi:hypothetical protein
MSAKMTGIGPLRALSIPMGKLHHDWRGFPAQWDVKCDEDHHSPVLCARLQVDVEDVVEDVAGHSSVGSQGF